MKKNLPVTQKNNDYSPDQRIVSTTDLKGRITHVNDDFVSISGFQPDELLNKNHNIIRHPDMPPAAFADLWQNIKEGKSWMGIVKNRCKNGDHYWVNAYVTPIFEGNTVTGYQSVRTKPSAQLIENAETFYKTLWKPASGQKKLISSIKLKLMGKIIAASSAVYLSGLACLLYLKPESYITSISILTLMFIFQCITARLIAKPWQQAEAEAREIFDNDVAKTVYTDRHDELGQLQLLIQMYQARLETVIFRINDTSKQLNTAVNETTQTVDVTVKHMDNQKREVEQVATAMNEMTSTVAEIAQNTCIAADAANNADDKVTQGKDIVNETVQHINHLAQQVQESMDVVNNLANDSQQIGRIVEVINEITDQTSLLALNAAIEAARAGEQGRGFAVVADEVRTLAGRTQQSTGEIQEMIKRLQTSTDNAVNSMQSGQTMAQHSVEHAEKAGDSLSSITNAVSDINQMVTQIATAAEEQSAVSEEINKNVVRINELSEDTLISTQVVNDSNNKVEQEVLHLQNNLKQFAQTKI